MLTPGLSTWDTMLNTMGGVPTLQVNSLNRKFECNMIGTVMRKVPHVVNHIRKNPNTNLNICEWRSGVAKGSGVECFLELTVSVKFKDWAIKPGGNSVPDSGEKSVERPKGKWEQRGKC